MMREDRERTVVRESPCIPGRLLIIGSASDHGRDEISLLMLNPRRTKMMSNTPMVLTGLSRRSTSARRAGGTQSLIRRTLESRESFHREICR